MGACSRQPPYHKHYFFATSDEVPEMSLRINTVCIFLTMESAVELNRHYWNSCYITWIFRKVFTKTVQLSRDTLGEQKVLESLFFRLSESLKFKIFPLVGTIVLPPRYTGFIINLSFWATLGLKHEPCKTILPSRAHISHAGLQPLWNVGKETVFVVVFPKQFK